MDQQPGSGASSGPEGTSSGASGIQNRRNRDQALLALLKAGDERAFGRLFDAWFDTIHDRVTNRGVAARNAAKIETKVFTDLWSRFQKSTSGETFGVLALRSARKHSPDTIEPRNPSGPTGEDSLTRGTDTGLLARDPAVAPLLWDAADVLGDRPREVLDLTTRHGFSADEIAGVIGDTAANVREVANKLPIGFGTTVRARILWRGGRPEHSTLAEALADEGDRFTPEVVRVINEHLKSCDQCRARAMLALPPIQVFAAIPIATAPAGLKEQVAVALIDAGVDVSGSEFVDADDLQQAATTPGVGSGKTASEEAGRDDVKSDDVESDRTSASVSGSGAAEAAAGSPAAMPGEARADEARADEARADDAEADDAEADDAEADSDANVDANADTDDHIDDEPDTDTEVGDEADHRGDVEVDDKVDDDAGEPGIVPLSKTDDGEEDDGEEDEAEEDDSFAAVAPISLAGLSENDPDEGRSRAVHKPIESTGVTAEIPEDERRPWKLIIGIAAAIIVIGLIITLIATSGSDNDEVATSDTVIRSTTTTQDPSKTTTTTRPTTTTSSSTTTTEPPSDDDESTASTTTVAPGGGGSGGAGGGGGAIPPSTTTTTQFVQTATANITINGKGQAVVTQGSGQVQVSWSASSNGPISVIIQGPNVSSTEKSGSASVCPGTTQAGTCPAIGTYTYTISVYDGGGSLLKRATTTLVVNQYG